MSGFLNGKKIMASGAILLLSMSALLGWIRSFLSGVTPGYSIALFPSNGLSVVTFGFVAFVIAVLAVIALLKNRAVITVMLGILALWLGIHFVLHISLADYRILDRLIDHNQQYSRMVRFSQLYLPENMGVEPFFSRQVEFRSVVDKFMASFRFLSWGWYSLMAGGFLLIVVSTGGLRGDKMRYAVVLIMILALGTVFLISPAIVSSYHKDQGDRYLAQGLYNDAVEKYSRAEVYNPQIYRSNAYRTNLGQSLLKSGKTDDANVHLYSGDLQRNSGHNQLAYFEYHKALEKSSGLRKDIIKRKLARTFIRDGLRAYKKNMKGEAVILWTKAVSTDATQIESYYYLSKAYFDLGQYGESSEASQSLIRLTRNPMVQANAYGIMGDSHFRLGLHNKARDFYERARKLDDFGNFMIMKRLGGT